MADTLSDAQGGLDSFIADQKNVEGECTLTLVEFDDKIDTVYRGDLKNFNGYQIRPRGSTALMDAIGRSINTTGDFLRDMLETERPEIVLLVIITDGGENASREFSRTKIKEMIEHQEKKYSWVVTFIGSGLDVARQALNIGISHDHVIATRGSGVAMTQAYHAHSMTTANVRRYGAAAAASYGALIDNDGDVETGAQWQTA